MLRRPQDAWRAFARDLGSSRDLAWLLFCRDLRAHYRQSALGYAWAFAPPLAWAGMFLILEAQGVLQSGDVGVPYAAHVLAGTALWQVFVDALHAPLRAFGQARGLFTKVNVPREAILLSALAEVGFGFLLRLPVLAAALVMTGVVPPTAALLPAGALALVLLGTAIGLAVLPFGLLYHDVGRGLALVTGFWLLLTPVAYEPSTEGWAATLGRWNPVSSVLGTVRAWWLGQPVESGLLGPAAIVVVGSLVLGAMAWLVTRVAWPHVVARMGA